MTTHQQEPSFAGRIDERPALRLDKLRKIRPRDLGARFVAGALTSLASGLISTVWGPRVGGIFLAFPAILAASLTLIEREEDTDDTREDARGAIIGALALTLFAVVAALGFGHVAAPVVLLLAAVTWPTTALLAYMLLWWK